MFWKADEPRALREAGEIALAAKHYDAARDLARRGIRAYPLDGINYRVLAMADAAQGRMSNVPLLLAIAEQRSQRDMPTRVLIASYALKSGDVPKALHELGLNLRIEPEIQPLLLPRMAALASIPQARPAIIGVLSENPPWRPSFLRVLATQASDSAAVAEIFNGLRLTRIESDMLIDRQIRDLDFTSAYVTWVATLPDEQRAALSNVFDGGFRFPLSNGGFGWRVTTDAEVDARVGPLRDGSGRGYSADFDQSRVRFEGLRQRLVLGPGRYVLSGRTRSTDLTTGRGLQWVITCAQGHNQSLAASPLLTGTHPWTTFEVAFEVPSARCAGQWLRFQMAARDRIAGHVETADIHIERTGSESPEAATVKVADTPSKQRRCKPHCDRARRRRGRLR
ncbi:MAG: hypothetical protein ABIQ97_00280 [Lysobacteraceae bacterium]